MSLGWFGDLIELVFLSLIGFGVFFGLAFWGLYRSSEMWRALAARYGQAKHTPVLARKIPETIVISEAGSNGWRLGWRQGYALYSWTIIEVLEDGLLISAIPPVNLVCKEIYLPFDMMTIKSHPWMLWQEPYAISMKKAPDLMLIIGLDTSQWIRRNTGYAPFPP